MKTKYPTPPSPALSLSSTLYSHIPQPTAPSINSTEGPGRIMPTKSPTQTKTSTNSTEDPTRRTPTQAPAGIKAKHREFLRLFLCIITILLGVSGAFGGGVIMHKAGGDGGKLLGGVAMHFDRNCCRNRWSYVLLSMDLADEYSACANGFGPIGRIVLVSKKLARSYCCCSWGR